jgi:hypothetical protein
VLAFLLTVLLNFEQLLGASETGRTEPLGRIDVDVLRLRHCNVSFSRYLGVGRDLLHPIHLYF